jgi:hypothetical protein
MFLARSIAVERGEMPRSTVSGVLGESIEVEAAIQLMHEAVARHFGDNRRGGDAEAERIAIDQPGLRCGMFHQKSVTEQAIGFQCEIVNGPLKGDAIGWTKTKHIDFLSLDDSHGYRNRALANDAERSRSLAGAQRFGVANEWAKLADSLRIQDDSGSNKWTGERSPPRFVNSGDARIAALEKCGVVLVGWDRNCHLRPASKNEIGA